MKEHIQNLGRAAMAAFTFYLLGTCAAALAQSKYVDMELLRRAGDIYWQAQVCGVTEPVLQTYFARTNELIMASPKTTSANKASDIWVEYQMHVMCRNRNSSECKLPQLAPQPCASFLPKFRSMRINQANWRVEEGLR